MVNKMTLCNENPTNFFESLHKEEWREVRLGETGKVIAGKTPSQNNPQDWGDSMLFITPTDYKNYYKHASDSARKISDEGIDRFSKIILPPNSILVTCIGSDMGKAVINKMQAITNQQINAIIPNNKTNHDFLYYSLVNMYPILRVFGANGTAVPILNKNDFENLKIPLPPLPIQNQIAEILSSFDDKIDLLHRQNQTLESLALTLFRHYFIENPDRNEWKIGKLGDWITETIGGDWGKEKPTNDFQEKVFCIRGTDIADLNKGLADKTPIRYIKNQKLLGLEPNEGDIVFEISGGTETQSTGRCIFVNQQVKDLFEFPIIFSNFCRLLRVKKKEYSYFLYLYLQFLYSNDEFFALENGTSGIKNLNYKALFYELEYKMPSEIQVIEFHTKIKIYFDKINANKKQIQSLQSMRDMLLEKIFSKNYDKIKEFK